MSETVYIGLGANLGDREHAPRRGAEGASRASTRWPCRRVSSLYESAPVGPAQPRYLNAVVELECGLPPLRLLTILQHIEQDLGRVRAERWGPRTIDLDILLWDGVVADPDSRSPTSACTRRFALEPLAELAPQARTRCSAHVRASCCAQLEPQDVCSSTRAPGR